WEISPRSSGRDRPTGWTVCAAIPADSLRMGWRRPARPTRPRRQSSTEGSARKTSAGTGCQLRRVNLSKCLTCQGTSFRRGRSAISPGAQQGNQIGDFLRAQQFRLVPPLGVPVIGHPQVRTPSNNDSSQGLIADEGQEGGIVYLVTK